jgi:hypothetical protein
VLIASPGLSVYPHVETPELLTWFAGYFVLGSFTKIRKILSSGM